MNMSSLLWLLVFVRVILSRLVGTQTAREVFPLNSPLKTIDLDLKLREIR